MPVPRARHEEYKNPFFSTGVLNILAGTLVRASKKWFVLIVPPVIFDSAKKSPLFVWVVW